LGPRSGTEAASAAALPPPLIATLSPWGAPGPDPEVVSRLRRAIAVRRTVLFRYRDGEGRETERTVEPFSLVIAGSAWYLHGWCRARGSFRLFKLARMGMPAVAEEAFDPYARAPIPDPFSGWAARYEDVVLSADFRAASAVAESFSSAAEEPASDGSSRVFRFRSQIDPWFVRFLLYLGPGVRVIAPERLRSEYAAAARAIAEDNAES
jgi:predicted DNA-binding transcriptional regulator YafY